MLPSDLLECPMEPLTLRERRRDAILDAAEALFLEQGYERTSLAEIVKQSGGSLATLYDLFGVKRRSKGTPDRRRRGTPFSDNMMLVC